jgi:hypothetical protein
MWHALIPCHALIHVACADSGMFWNMMLNVLNAQ